MLHFIVNPRSLRGKSKGLLEKIEARLKAEQREYVLHKTEKKGDATAYAREISGTAGETIVAIGGDGMANDVLCGIIDPATVTFGLIPAGTGNDFAVSGNIPHGMAALELILKSEPKYTDYLQFDDGHRSLNVAGQGIDVDILERCDRMKVFRGKSKYFLSLIATLFRYAGNRVEIEVDGKKWQTNSMIVSFCNGRVFGGGIPICPPAEIADGKMELVVVDCPKRSKLLGALVKLMKGKLLTLPFAHRFSCERAVVTPLSSHSAQFDGEVYPVESLGVSIVTQKLLMYRG